MEFHKSKQNTIKRGRTKANYDSDVIYSILDSVKICNIAFTIDGIAMSQPINFGRSGNKIYLHGSTKNRMTDSIIKQEQVCLSVWILDGMKLTRSAFHHSVNFRSAVIFGSVHELTSEDEKLIGLKAIINHFVADRWQHCRHPNKKELKATRVIEITIKSASAKIANSPVQDKEADLMLDYWAGLIPVKTIYQQPIADSKLKNEINIPEHIAKICK